MRLLASLMNDNRWHELLAEIDATSDTHEQGDDIYVHRFITGTILTRGPIWNDYISYWQRMAASGLAAVNPQLVPGEREGRPYFMANLLEVDHDLYHEPAGINIDGSTIRLALTELYTDPIEDYAEYVRERNQAVVDLYRRFDEGQFTVNDLRAFRGLPPFPPPHGDRLLPPDAVAQLRRSILDDPLSAWARNRIY